MDYQFSQIAAQQRFSPAEGNPPPSQPVKFLSRSYFSDAFRRGASKAPQYPQRGGQRKVTFHENKQGPG